MAQPISHKENLSLNIDSHIERVKPHGAEILIIVYVLWNNEKPQFFHLVDEVWCLQPDWSHADQQGMPHVQEGGDGEAAVHHRGDDGGAGAGGGEED